ncbi:NAD(P)/FAD-dependent oxidoreductase [Alphaproteobacteria bacterium LSUCC0684]
MRAEADFCVIGGGIAGISVAALLSAEASVVVLESEDVIGFHSTGRSAAMYIANYGPPAIRVMTKLSGSVFENPAGITDAPLLSPRGELIVAREDEIPDLEKYLDGSEGMERIDARAAVDLMPILNPQYIHAAAYEAGAADINVAALFQGYAAILRRQGGEIITRARVQDMKWERGSWRVETAIGKVSAPVVINAAGGWADQVAMLADIDPKGIQPMRRSAALIPPPDGHDISRWPLVASASEDWYCRPDAGNLMVSPADEDPVEAQDIYPDDMVLAMGIHRFENATTCKVTRVSHRWAGLRSFAPDHNPVAGFDPQHAGFFWLAGQGGYGIQTSPAMAQYAFDLLMGQTPTPDTATCNAMSPYRFSKGVEA